MLCFYHPRYILFVSLLAIFPVTLSGCGAALRSVRKVAHVRGELVIYVHVNSAVNHNSPIAVDVLNVQDKSVLKLVSAMSAEAWFQQRTDFERSHPHTIQRLSWEWVPGQNVGQVTVPGTGVAEGVVFFANYQTKGAHRALLPQSGHISITFAADDFILGSPK